MDGYPTKAKERVEALISTLRLLAEKDPEQEVRGMAIPVLDAAVDAIKRDLGPDPVVDRVGSVISPEAIDAGEPVRAVDALLVAEQLNAAIGPWPAPRRPRPRAV